MFFGDLDIRSFVADLWRTRPAKASTAGTPFERVRISDRAFVKAVRSLRDAPSSDVITHPGVVFAQELERTCPALQGVGREIASALGGSSVWIDGVRAGAGGSLGPHFDHSDNFVVQQTGTKIWRVAPPTSLTAEELALRMAGAPDVGGACFPDEFEEFELRAGEVLYIPLFWIHYGISRGRSLSLSVVCNATSVVDGLLPSIKTAMSERAALWAPFPVGAQGPGTMEAAVSAALSDIRRELDDPRFRAEVLDRCRERMLASPFHSARPPVDFEIDMDRIRRFVEAPVIRFDLRQLVVPAGPTASARLRVMTARVFAKRFFLAVSKGWTLLSDESKRQMQSVVQIVQESEAATLETFFVRPEITSWILRAAEAAASRHLGRFREICSYAGLLFLPLAIELKECDPNRSLTIQLSGEGLVHLLPYALAIDLGQAAATTCQASVTSGVVRLTAGRDQWTVAPLAIVHGDSMPSFAHRLHSAGGGCFLILSEHAWFARFLPSGAASRASRTADLSDRTLLQLRDSIEEGVQLVQQFWPEAMADLRINVVAFSPLMSEGVRPHNETIPAFRSLVRSSARPSYLSAQMLVHEAAHNRLNSAMDVFDLVDGEDLPVWSPFVQSARPVTAVLHGVVSFLNEIQLTGRLIGRVEPVCNTSMERYLKMRMADVSCALTTMQEFSSWTPEGQTVFAECVRVFDELAERYA